MNEFKPIFDFEKAIANYFGAPYAVATDCCTHALEMCLQLHPKDKVECPRKTYISVPFMLIKIKRNFLFVNKKWKGCYNLTPNIIDGATFWKKNGYIPGTKLCISFHIKKHINIGRGGMILLDNETEYKRLMRMRYDGRSIYENVFYKDEDISDIGYHYYMTPETAKKGLKIFKQKRDIKPIQISYKDYSDVSKFKVFNANTDVKV
jgi:dTDP-4-amino-4,6-dideoxygalactose transaminase